MALPALSTYLGHVKVTDTYCYVTAIPELMSTVSTRFERFVRSAVEADVTSTKSSPSKSGFPSLLEKYFCEYLLKQRNASPETICSYRDTFRLFLAVQ